MDLLVKFVSPDISIAQIAWGRFSVQLIYVYRVR
jgi:hypothetical protein